MEQTAARGATDKMGRGDASRAAHETQGPLDHQRARGNPWPSRNNNLAAQYQAKATRRRKALRMPARTCLERTGAGCHWTRPTRQRYAAQHGVYPEARLLQQ